MKKIIILVALIIATGSFIYGYLTYENSYKGEIVSVIPEDQPNSENKESSQESPLSEIGKVSVTLEELAIHNKESDCWVVYKDSVYDVTKFLPLHPGGVEKIAQFCGTTNFEETFNEKHGNTTDEKIKIRLEKGLLQDKGQLK